MRTIPEALGSDSIYWLMDSFLMLSLSIYIFIKSKKNIVNLFFAAACIVLFCYDIFDYLYIILMGGVSSGNVKIAFYISIALVVYCMIFRKRYEWSKLKSEDYDRRKIQAIYSKPSTFITLLGAATSFSPKCSVRYSYDGKMVRFKRGFSTPIMTNIVIKKTDIIESTDIDPDIFYRRFEEIKNKNYKLITFNCRHLFKSSN